MFAGRRPSSSNVRSMQLFYELKQLYPAASDAALSGCIAAYVAATADGQGHKSDLFRLLEEALEENKEDPAPPAGQMGRPAPAPLPPAPLLPSSSDHPPEAMDAPQAMPRAPPKRPDRLDVGRRDTKGDLKATPFHIRPSEKCKDVHRLLNAEVGDKPPLSPSSVQRLAAVRSERSATTPTDAHREAPRQEERSLDAQQRLTQDAPPTKKETCSTPTQTTDTLTGGCGNDLALSLNVNCSLDLVPPPRRRTSVAQLVPAQPWLAPPPAGHAPYTGHASSPGHAPSFGHAPRSFTSVSLTLRPPSDDSGAAPAAPIDITSKNSTLTYSTSSFDPARGMQSRLQITVGPAGGSVSSVRVRPRSFHAEEGRRGDGEWGEGAWAGRARAGSVGRLAAVAGSEAPLLLKQQGRIEKLRIEMKTRRDKLESVKREIEEIERNRLELSERGEEKRLLLEIKHLTWQCKDLESDGEAFYSNIYTGQLGPLTLDLGAPTPRHRQPPPRRRLPHRGAPPPPNASEPEGPKWNCGLCTFLNHPVLDKCEQCEMPRILHGTTIEAVNPNVTFDALRMLNGTGARATARSLSLGNAGFYGGRAVCPDSSRSTPNMLGLVRREN